MPYRRSSFFDVSSIGFAEPAARANAWSWRNLAITLRKIESQTMKIYWGLSSIPELATLPSAERKAIWRASYRKSFSDKRVWMALAVCGLSGGLGAAIGSDSSYRLIGVVLGGAFGGLVFGQAAIIAALPHIRAAVKKRNGGTA